MLRFFIIASLAASLNLACLTDAGGCLCGADSSDTLAEHDLSFEGSHSLDDECACYCGNDAPFDLPKDRECSEYDGTCRTAQGEDSILVCE